MTKLELMKILLDPAIPNEATLVCLGQTKAERLDYVPIAGVRPTLCATWFVYGEGDE